MNDKRINNNSVFRLWNRRIEFNFAFVLVCLISSVHCRWNQNRLRWNTFWKIRDIFDEFQLILILIKVLTQLITCTNFIYTYIHMCRHLVVLNDITFIQNSMNLWTLVYETKKQTSDTPNRTVSLFRRIR